MKCRICLKDDFTEYLKVEECIICKKCAFKCHEEVMKYIVDQNRKGALP